MFFFKQKTAYEMRISDWSSYVCSSDLVQPILENRYRRFIDDTIAIQQRRRIRIAQFDLERQRLFAALPVENFDRAVIGVGFTGDAENERCSTQDANI